MKITTLLLVAVILHVSAATSLAQKITLNEKNTALVDIFNKISNQTGYDFAFSTETLENTKPVTINVKNEELIGVLTKIFQGQNLEFSLENKIVTVKPKETSLLEKVTENIKTELTQITITGKVVDETGQPMTGVTVREKEHNYLTATGVDGRFTLNASNNDALIVFTFIGYEPKEFSVKDLPTGVIITMKVSSTNLHEVTINKGFYTEKQMLSTGDVSTVSSKEIEEQPVNDPVLALEGKVAGLDIQQTSGVPGSNSTILLRGVNSIANGNFPLFIVDGVPFSNTQTLTPQIGSGALGNGSSYTFLGGRNGNNGMSPFNALNPDDIENITVLKDADALAIYGSRGANGVILITTKKGHPGNTTVTFDISQGQSKVAHFMNLMNTSQYLQMRHEAYSLDGLPFPSITTTPTNTAYDLNGVWDTTRNTNWQKVLLGGTGQNTNAQLSVSGGSENTQFYIGGGFTRQTTVFPGDFGDKKSSMNFSLTHTSANKRFLLQFSGGYLSDENNTPASDPTAKALTLAPDAPALYNADGSLNWQVRNGTSTFSNPLFFTVESFIAVTHNLTSNLLLRYNILPGLNFSTSLGYIDDDLKQTNLNPSTSTAPPNNTNPSRRTNNFGYTDFTNWIFEPKLTYDEKIGNGKLDVILGATFQQNKSISETFYASGFASDALISNPANAATFSYGGLNDAIYRYNAVQARVGYSWMDKYLINITGSRDGSSRFGPDNQWGNFGAIGAGWIFSKEKFIQSSFSWLSFGKLRASYGITGSDQIGDYQYLASYSSNGNTYLGTTQLSPDRIPNPYYGWEVDKKLEGGLELGFLQDKINFTASYYRNRTGNQLVGYALPSISGFTMVQENLPAVVQNTGLEVTFRSVNLQSGPFKWITSFNLTLPTNKLVSYPNLSSSNYAGQYVIGQSLYIQERYKNAGVNPADGNYQAYSSTGVATESTSSPADYIVIPPVTRKWYGMLTNNLSFKGFQLDFSFQFVKQTGYNFWSGGALGSAGSVNYNVPVIMADNTWEYPGDQSMFGRLSTSSTKNKAAFVTTQSDFIISDASFIRLKSAALSYNLPQNWQRMLHLKNARIYIEGENLLTFTSYFGLDPENQSTTSLPPLRTIVLGIHTSF